AMQGANHELYKKLANGLNINVIASGGVSSIEDIKRLKSIDFYGAIIGKAYYTKAINLNEAIKVAR
ncbi:MAG: 1-(5-phosphoribosyl)-5-((5-phosphoribosylamino)methylideneamino)imidazole-4-carboxamide isomerase, partial [Clostridia bacterium]|nr:1-(5-phosphoribosyl)-5-((5-phosphoribosylamino)methylideneamino)imidazole-4-carboxamide isomerase [Clostridia bacterium]